MLILADWQVVARLSLHNKIWNFFFSHFSFETRWNIWCHHSGRPITLMGLSQWLPQMIYRLPASAEALQQPSFYIWSFFPRNSSFCESFFMFRQPYKVNVEKSLPRVLIQIVRLIKICCMEFIRINPLQTKGTLCERFTSFGSLKNTYLSNHCCSCPITLCPIFGIYMTYF